MVLLKLFAKVSPLKMDDESLCSHQFSFIFVTEATVILCDLWSSSNLLFFWSRLHLDAKRFDAVKQLDLQSVLIYVVLHGSFV